jgi:hypothetical protein
MIKVSSLLPFTMPSPTSTPSTPVLELIDVVFRTCAAREQLNDHPEGAEGGEGEDGKNVTHIFVGCWVVRA